MNYGKLWDFVKTVAKNDWGKAAVIAAAIAAVLATFALTSCGAMRSVNQAIRYEYKYLRETDKNVKAKSEVFITNEEK